MLSKLKGIESYKKYLEMLALSTALAGLMLFIAFGLVFFAEGGKPLPKHSVLLILAVSFIVFWVFCESKGESEGKGKSKASLKSPIKGLFLAICATFAFVVIAGGVKLTIERAIPIGIEAFISALAICMIVSMTFLSLLKPRETTF